MPKGKVDTNFQARLRMPYITGPVVFAARQKPRLPASQIPLPMTRRSSPSTHTIVWLLTLALLFAQTLGLMHGTLHGWGSGSATTAVAKAHVDHVDHGSIASLFASHASDADCRLYDQASHGSAAPHVAPLVLPVLLPTLAVAIFQGEALARWAALFDARGPPLTL